MNPNKAALSVALLALCVSVLAAAFVPDSSADGGELRGEGFGENIHVLYVVEELPLVEVSLGITPPEDVYFSIAGLSYVETIGPIPGEKSFIVGLGGSLSVGEYSILVTTVGGSRVADCTMEVQVYYGVSFDANGGSGKMETQYLPAGSEYALPECGFKAPSGETFSHWAVGGAQYVPGDMIPIGTSVSIQACWEHKEASADMTVPLVIAAAIILALLIAVAFVLRRGGDR